MEIMQNEMCDSVCESNCCPCGNSSVKIEPHTCPYACDIGGDYETLCNCCDSCTIDCAMSI